MRVLYVIDSLDRPGGAEQALASMAPGLVAGGVDLHVASLTERDGLQPDLIAAGARLHPVGAATRPARTREVAGLVRRLRPDLVHTTLFEADLAGRSGAALARTPVVSSLVNVAYGPEHRADPGLSAAKVRAAQAADAATCQVVRRFHALTEHVATVMSRRLLIRESRVQVMPRGRSRARLGERSPERRAAVRSALGLAPDAPMIVAAARHEHQKGLDVLVEALAAVRRTHPDAQLVVAGREGVDHRPPARHGRARRHDRGRPPARRPDRRPRPGRGRRRVRGPVAVGGSRQRGRRGDGHRYADRGQRRGGDPRDRTSRGGAARAARPARPPRRRDRRDVRRPRRRAGRGPTRGWPGSPTATRSSASPTR